ncbi:TPA: hypothetical protein ACG1TX_001866, partial [Vibrio vulnificus]
FLKALCDGDAHAVSVRSDAYSESFNTVSHEHKTWRQVARYYEDNIGISVRVVKEEQFIPLVISFLAI